MRGWRQGLLVVVAIAGLSSSPGWAAKGRILFSPEVGFFSLSATDLQSGARAVVSTRHNFGFSLSFLKPFSRRSEWFIRFRAKAFGTEAPNNARVLKNDQVHFSPAFGMNMKLTRKINFGIYIEYMQYLLMQSATSNTIFLDAPRWPGAGAELNILLLPIYSFELRLRTGAAVALPVGSIGYLPAFHYDTRLVMGFDGSRFNILGGPYFRYQTVKSGIISQAMAELGGTLDITIKFGVKHSYGRPRWQDNYFHYP